MLFETKSINVHYDHVHAVRDVSIQVQEGETIALIGANGAGKTSTLRAITGLERIKGGEIWYNGQRIDRLAPDALVALGIAMVPEGRHVFPFMSVKDNLLLGAHLRYNKVKIRSTLGGVLRQLYQFYQRPLLRAYLRRRAEIRSTLDGVLHRFPRLRERYGQSAGTLSGGEQQMLVIGRALMARPKLLLFDEPSLGIAPKLIQDIARSIVAINRQDGVSVILVEQNSRMALKISHRAYAMSTGSIAISGNSRELLHDDRIRALYLGGEVSPESQTPL